MKFSVGLAATAFVTLGSSAHATVSTPVISTFAFDGQCFDCTEEPANTPAHGLLTLQNYTLGDQLQLSNFVSFSYASQKISFTMGSITTIMGRLDSVPGVNTVRFEDSTRYFETSQFEGGFWDTGLGHLPGSVSFDTGFDGEWSAAAAAPEPGTWSMMLAGFGAAGLALRSRKKAVVRFG